MFALLRSVSESGIRSGTASGRVETLDLLTGS